MSKPAPIYGGLSCPCSPACALLHAPRCLAASQVALLVHDVSTTRATTPDRIRAGRQSLLSRISRPAAWPWNGCHNAVRVGLRRGWRGIRRGCVVPEGLTSGGGGVVTGLVVDGTGFEVLAGDERIGSRRPISSADVELLTGLAGRYVPAVQANANAGVFVGRPARPWPGGPLAAGRLQPLTAAEQAALAEISSGPLYAAWGGPAPRPRRDPALDLQPARLALLADDPEVAVTCAPGRRDGPARPGRHRPAGPDGTAGRGRGRARNQSARPSPGHRRTRRSSHHPRRAGPGRAAAPGRLAAVHSRRL